uniref:Uncharacterized protein n=1 Tax=Knipowitschia caucasica TaxID=637954 RepID=A0AAV2M0M7_KNICA
MGVKWLVPPCPMGAVLMTIRAVPDSPRWDLQAAGDYNPMHSHISWRSSSAPPASPVNTINDFWHSEVLQSGLLSGTWLPSSPRGKSPDTRSKVLRLKPVLTGASSVSAETLWERSGAGRSPVNFVSAGSYIMDTFNIQVCLLPSPVPSGHYMHWTGQSRTNLTLGPDLKASGQQLFTQT